jgi:hypothetical protein
MIGGVELAREPREHLEFERPRWPHPRHRPETSTTIREK